MAAHVGFIKKRYGVTVLLLALVYAGVLLCSGFSPVPQQPGFKIFSDSLYAGSASCMKCHKAIYDSFAGTAHWLTSRPAAGAFIKGSFEEGQNQFSFNQFINVKMEKKDSSFFQTAYINGEASHSEPMDIVVGSGRKGQTFLYWKDSALYQLPISYYVPAKSWCNSPGFPAAMPRFNRNVSGRCLECHGSRAVIENNEGTDYFDKNSIVFGVDCERCHGPSANHVAFHNANPGEKTAKYILQRKNLSRQQNLDLCALCHSGIRSAIKPPFSYHAGDKLAAFSLPRYSEDSAATLDVHGNQYGLLSSSKCFKSSQMVCSSCHNVHGQEINQPALFSQRCINCHNPANAKTCTIKPVAGMVLSDNCIDCHMPSMPSKAIFLQTVDAGKSSADFVRSHRIAIYAAATKEFIKQSKAKQKTQQ